MLSACLSLHILCPDSLDAFDTHLPCMHTCASSCMFLILIKEIDHLFLALVGSRPSKEGCCEGEKLQSILVLFLCEERCPTSDSKGKGMAGPLSQLGIEDRIGLLVFICAHDWRDSTVLFLLKYCASWTSICLVMSSLLLYFLRQPGVKSTSSDEDEWEDSSSNLVAAAAVSSRPLRSVGLPSSTNDTLTSSDENDEDAEDDDDNSDLQRGHIPAPAAVPVNERASVTSSEAAGLLHQVEKVRRCSVSLPNLLVEDPPFHSHVVTLLRAFLPSDVIL